MTVPPPLDPDHAPLGLRSQILTLAQLLSLPQALTVPRYQRPYSWTTQEVHRLLADLLMAFERGAPFYFLGHLVFVRLSPRLFEIVDGQQRLATLTVLIAYLRDRLGASRPDLQILIDTPEAGPGRFRLALRPTDQDFFAMHVQAPGGMAGLAAFDAEQISTDPGRSDNQIGPTAHALIIEAAQVCAEVLGEIDDATLNAFTDFLRRKVTFDLIEADERGGAVTLFRVTNDRGRDLSAADILKCDLLDAASLPATHADEAANAWEELEAELGRDQFGRLLTLMPVIITGEPIRSPGDLSVFRTTVLSRVEAATFMTAVLPRYGAGLRDVLAGKVNLGSASVEINRRLRCLQLLGEEHWLAPSVAFLGDDSCDGERAVRFFQALDRLAFTCFLGIIRPSEREVRFARVITALRDERRLYGPGGALELTPSEARRLGERLRAPFRKDPKVRRVVAMRVNAALPGGEALSVADDITVEHILPVRGGPSWERVFSNRAEREVFAHLIGNWVLLSRRLNQKAADKPFDQKKKIYFAAADGPVRALTQDIVGTSSWTADQLFARHERLVRALLADFAVASRVN